MAARWREITLWTSHFVSRAAAPAMLTVTAYSSILTSMEVADIAIIYQDHHLLVINKPAGIVIHPTYKHATGTLWDALLVFLAQQEQDDWQPPVLADDPTWEHAPEQVKLVLRQRRLTRLWEEEGLLPRPCLLHRLDKNTSGVVALARTARACHHLGRQFNEHIVIKRYLALVQAEAPDWARPRASFQMLKRAVDGREEQVEGKQLFSGSPGDEFIINGPLGRDDADRRRCVVIADGSSATTLVRTLATEGSFALLDVQPITGRTHQIRAHLAASGCAIVGDPMYSAPPLSGTAESALSRQFLHAYSLTLRCYPDNNTRTFLAPLPPDLVQWLERYSPALLEAAQRF
jgi:23S rRNA pseudouridine1911/1915/1917 synthase